MTTVVVAAASSSARAGLEALLARDASLRVVAAAPPGSALTVALDSGTPDVLLMEIAGDPAAALGAELASQLPERASERLPAIVLLAEAVSGAAVAGALRAGARAVLRWDAAPDEILAAVHAAAAGLVTLPGDVATELAGPTRFELDGRPDEDAADMPSLTPRERDVLAMMAEGVGNKTIARGLGISEHTVKTHVAALFAKLGASSRTEAVARGVRRGLVVL